MGPVSKMYKKFFIKRYDDEGYKHFFTSDDFEGLQKDEFTFASAQNTQLKGFIYSYEGCDKDTLVVFCHGIGEGHIQYTKEIEAICRGGFRVLTYDVTGCGFSGGEDIRCISQSLSDLDSCLKYIKENDCFGAKHIYLIGHSWGGFAAGNILNFHSDIEKAVVISGFVSIKYFIGNIFKGVLSPLSKGIFKLEKEQGGKYFESSMIDALNKTSAKVLVIHSTDDKSAAYSIGAACLKENVKNPNVRYIITENRNHNPYYTEDAVKYLNEVFGAFSKASATGKIKTAEQKKAFMKDVDWNRMTSHDNAVIDEIVSFLKDE